MNINLVETYLEANGHGYSNDTITSYLTDIKQFLEFALDITGESDECQAIAKIQYIHCIKFLSHMKERALSPFTMNRKLSSLTSFLDFCVDLKLAEENSFKKLKRFVTSDIEQESDYLTRSEYLTLMETIKSGRAIKMKRNFIVARDTFLFTLLLTTGLRITEARTLTFRQFDIENKKIRPLRKGRRFQDIHINDELINLYQAYIKERENIYLEEGVEDTIFVSVNGNFISTKDCNRTLKKYCEVSGIKVVTCHDLRHTCATTLMQRGANLEDVSKLLGHKSLSTTSRYIHGEASNVCQFMGL